MNCNSFKTFFSTLILGILSTLLITNLAIASPLLEASDHLSNQHFLLSQASDEITHAKEKPQPKMAQPEIKSPQPTREQTPEQKADNQSLTRQEAPTTAKSEKPTSGGPYDMKAIEEFYKSLYGS